MSAVAAAAPAAPAAAAVAAAAPANVAVSVPFAGVPACLEQAHVLYSIQLQCSSSCGVPGWWSCRVAGYEHDCQAWSARKARAAR